MTKYPLSSLLLSFLKSIIPSAFLMSLFLLTVSSVSAQLIQKPLVKTGALLNSPKAATSSTQSIYSSIVRVEVAAQVPSYREPWKAGRFSGGRGTGFLIAPNRFLTNAHVVSNARRILITLHGSARKHPAKILYIAHDCDLAILAVDDPNAFIGIKPLKIGGVPQLESQVRVIGYPVGGNRISVTRGVVSRIDFNIYSHTRSDQHLVVQIDAAINPGNSGGPVLQKGKVVGVAFQGLRSADNTGYMIPTPVIRRFLKDIEDGHYDHYVDLGLREFPLFNPAMRKKFNLAPNAPGILITQVTADSTCAGIIKKNDILIAINDIPIDAAGRILIDGEKVNMNEIVERKFSEDKIKLQIIRDGKMLEKMVTLKPFPPARIYSVSYGKKPRFTTFAGLVFQPLTRNLYAAYHFKNIEVRRLFSHYLDEAIFKTRKDIVILTRILPDSINTHISGHVGTVIKSINGVKITSLQQVHELLHPATPPKFFIIRCEGLERPIIIPGDQAAEASKRIETNYGIGLSHRL